VPFYKNILIFFTVYSVFGFFEVILILSNIVFHASGVIIIKKAENFIKEINDNLET
jgi:hypothetical protein